MFPNRPLNVSIIHVGNMNNRGTQALISSDVHAIKTIFENSHITISTTDENGVYNLNLPVNTITSPIIDIPFEKADQLLRKQKEKSRGVKYMFISLFYFIFMFIQASLSIFSAIFLKIGLKPFFREKILHSLNESDVVISCSDENFKEGSYLLPYNISWALTWYSMIFSRTWDILMARFFHKRLIMFPNSVGPFRTFIGKFLSRISLSSCETVLIREPISLNIVKDMNVATNVILTSDSALLHQNKIELKETNNKPVTIGVSPGFYSNILTSEECNMYIKSHAEALDFLINRYDFNILLLPHNVSGFKYDDLDVSKRIYNLLQNNNKVRLIDSHSLDEFLMNLKCVDIHISSKLHPCIFAVSNYIPTISIAYDHKQVGFHQALNLDNFVINIRDLNSKILIEKIECLLDNYISIRNEVELRVTSLKAKTFSEIKNSLLKPYGDNY